MTGTILHGLVEQDPPKTVTKFIRYNLPKLIKQVKEKTKEKESLGYS
jgi:hypothetical protein